MHIGEADARESEAKVGNEWIMVPSLGPIPNDCRVKHGHRLATGCANPALVEATGTPRRVPESEGP